MATASANNFDLIRLIAALQVAVHHATMHLQVEHGGSWFFILAGLFPGVPIFFFVSGFLISKSYERNANLADYVPNRILRLYPALIACFLVSVLSVFASGYFHGVDVAARDFLSWTAAQLTVGQFFNPEFMRGYGVGVLNGSLWTIAVELQFYILLPALYALSRWATGAAAPANRLLLGLILAFMLINQAYNQGSVEYAEALWYKLVGVSFAPWLYMFMLGVLAQRNQQLLGRLLAGRFLTALLVYCALALAARGWFGWSLGNQLNPVMLVALSALTFAAAFSHNTLSDRFLRRNDISYGVYIYHMPVVNFLLSLSIMGTLSSLALALALTVFLGFASWRLIEKPALALKRHPLYQHYAPAGGRTRAGGIKRG